MTHLLWLTLLTPFLVLAGNTPKAVHAFDDGDTISLTLSSLDVNTLRVSHDRIVSITCPPGFCSSHANPKDKFGTVNLNLGIQAPFTAQVATEKGRLLALLISPKAVPGKIVELTYNQRHLDEPSYFERGFDYPIALTEFTKAMMHWRQHPSPISGVRIHPIDPDTLPKDDGPLPLTPKVVFSGKDYSGILYEVTNATERTQTLTTAQFYSVSARSAALERYTLAPGESTSLYLITGGGAQYAQ